jgi:DNA-binding transcriptional MocR family regulator
MGASLTTVLRAYGKLEVESLVVAHPQSGFYVRLPQGPSKAALPGPEPRSAAGIAPRVAHSESSKRPLSYLLTGSQPPIEMLPVKAIVAAVKRSVLQFDAECVMYAHSEGRRDLRELIANRLLLGGCLVDPDELIITGGCTEALMLSVHCVAKSGDTIAIESPNHYGLFNMLSVLGINVIEVPCSPADGMDLDALEEILDSNAIAAVIVTPNFSNPLGSLMPLAARHRIVKLLQARGIALIEDDVYGDLRYGPEIIPNCKALDRSGNVLFCSSVSKTLAPGFRIGWLAAGAHVERARTVKFAMSVQTPHLTQVALAEFLTRHRFSRVVSPAAKVYQRNVRAMIRCILETFPEGVRVCEPKGGYLIWVEMPAGADGKTLHLRCKDEGFHFIHGAACTVSGLYKNCISLSAAVWNAEAERQVRRIGAMAREMVASAPG